MLASLVFWKFYFDKEHPSRDKKLYDLYKNLLVSNVILFTIIFFGGAGIIASLKLYYYPPFVFFCMFLCLIGFISQVVFQVRKCWGAIKRIEGFNSLREDLKEGIEDLVGMSGYVVSRVFEELIDELEKLFQEFNGVYEEEIHKNKEQNTNQNINNEKNKDIKRIFKKYDLPLDSNAVAVRKHFRSLAKKYHPDMPNGNEKLFIELTEDMNSLMELLKEKVNA